LDQKLHSDPDVPFYSSDINVQLYEVSSGDPSNSPDNSSTLSLSYNNYNVQAVTDLNLPELFSLYRVPFKWGITKILGYIFPEILFGCPTYNLIFSLPLTSEKDPPPLPHPFTAFKPQTVSQVLSHLPLKDLLSLSSTNHAWRLWITANNSIWRGIHDQLWDIPPCSRLVQTVGWYVVVVLKSQRSRIFKKAFCAKFSEFEIN